MELEERKVKLVWVDLDTRELKSVAIFRSDGTPMTWGARHPDLDYVDICPAIVRPVSPPVRGFKDYVAVEIGTLRGKTHCTLYPLDPFYQALRSHSVRLDKVRVCEAFANFWEAEVPRLRGDEDVRIESLRPLMLFLEYPRGVPWLYIVAPQLWTDRTEGTLVKALEGMQ